MNFRDEEFLYTRIMQMVQRAGKVHIDQILRMFRIYTDYTVNHQIKQLSRTYRINLDLETGFVTSRQRVMRNDITQNLITTALWVIASEGSEVIDEYWLAAAPSQWLWVERGNQTIRDITVLFPGNVDNTGLLWYRTKGNYIPPDVDDTVEHIALVYNEADGIRAKAYGFSQYCILDPKTYEPKFVDLVSTEVDSHE